MRLMNNSQRMYQHGEYNLKPGMNLEVPKEVAKVLLQMDGVKEYVDPAEAKVKEAAKDEEIKALKAEVEKLKAELAEAKAKEAKDNKKSDKK